MEHTQDLIDTVREELAVVGKDAGFWTDKEIVKKLNEGQSKAEDHIANETEDHFVVQVDSPALSDASFIEFSEVFRRLRLMEDKQGTPIVIAQEARVFEQQEQILHARTGYYIEGNRIYLGPESKILAAGTFKIHGELTLPSLATGLVAAASASSLTLPAIPTVGKTSFFTHAYIDTTIEITSGTGVGERKVCTAYDGPTRVLTLDSPWVATPTTASIYATYSRIPPRYHHLLSVYAIMRLKQGRGDDARPWAVIWDEGVTIMTASLKRTVAQRNIQPFDIGEGLLDYGD